MTTEKQSQEKLTFPKLSYEELEKEYQRVMGKLLTTMKSRDLQLKLGTVQNCKYYRAKFRAEQLEKDLK